MNLSVSSINSILIPPSYLLKSIIYNNNIYLYGGELISNLTCYNIKNKTYTTIETFGDIPNFSGHSINIYKKKIYLFGGEDKNKLFNNDIYELDLDNYNWKKILTDGDKPKPRLNHCSNIINNCLYIFSGCDWNTPYFDLYSFNLGILIYYEFKIFYRYAYVDKAIRY